MRLSPGISTPSKRGINSVVKVLVGDVSPLLLFVARVLTNDADDIFAAHNLTGFAQSFYRGSDFHFLLF